MKKILLILSPVLFVLSLYALWQYSHRIIPRTIAAPQNGISTAFSPKGGAFELVMKTIAACRDTLYMATYDFTSPDIADQIIAKYRSGVRVFVVADKRASNSQHTQTDDLRNAGVPIRLNGRYAIHHHKFILCDGKVVQTGSFNYSRSARSRNAENVLVVWNSPELFNAYREEWQRLWLEAREN